VAVCLALSDVGMRGQRAHQSIEIASWTSVTSSKGKCVFDQNAVEQVAARQDIRRHLALSFGP
jgi:hypothetical protein